MPARPFCRYAIYYTPALGPLAQFGAAWLGHDIASGAPTAHSQGIEGLPAPIAELSKAPRRYGFHATIKPPFRLSPGASQEALIRAVEQFCADQPPVALDGAELARLGRFLAIIATGDTSALTRLAAHIVRQLDSFRAPQNADEIARHQRPQMGAAKAENLRLWGYPHVMDQFRWHMTLTGKRPARETAQIQIALAPIIAPLLAPPPVIDALSLVGEDADGFFHLIRRVPLTG